MSSDIPTPPPADKEPPADKAFNPRTDCGRPTLGLMKVAGTHLPWVENSSEAAKQASQGIVLIGVSLLAFGGVVGASWSVNYQHRLYWFNFVIAVVWAILVFAIDRWITNSIDYGELLTGPQHPAKRAWRAFWFYASRVIMAFVVGFVISESVALGVFDSAINRELQTMQSERNAGLRKSIEDEHQQKIDTAEQAVKTANENVTTATKSEGLAQQRWQAEHDGLGGTRDSGPSPDWAQCSKQGDDPRSICAESNDYIAYGRAHTETQNRINDAATAQRAFTDVTNSVKADVDAEFDRRKRAIAADTNLATRHEAMIRLVSNNWGYLSIWIALTVVLLVVDLTPLFLKLFAPHTPYLENARRDAATKYAGTEMVRRKAMAELADVAHDADEREHRNRMDAVTRDHEHQLAADAAQHAARHTRDAMRAQSANDPAVTDLANRYLQASYAHIRTRVRRWHDTASTHRATPAPGPSRNYRSDNAHNDHLADDGGPEPDSADPTPAPTPQPSPPTPPGQEPGIVPTPIRTPRDGYGLAIGKRFPDYTVMDQPGNAVLVNDLDMEWDIKNLLITPQVPEGFTNEATLYQAVDASAPDNGKEYVFKVYKPRDALYANQQALSRAELLAVPAGTQVNHNIARVYFSGFFDNRAVLVTEKYPNTLQTWQDLQIENKEFRLCDAINIAEQILGALGNAWTRVYPDVPDFARVHLDVKPPNIGMTDDGIPKVFDWALSRPLDEQGHTPSRISMGTPYYAPPEQAAPGDLWPTHLVAADVYAWAATLYEMITGKPPHRAEADAHGASLKAIADRHPDALHVYNTLRQQPPPSLSKQIEKYVPPELERLLQRCLSPTPGDRHIVATDGSLVARRAAAGVTLAELMKEVRYVRTRTELVSPDGTFPADTLVGGFTRFQKANTVLTPLEASGPNGFQQQQNGFGQQQQQGWSDGTNRAARPFDDDDDDDAPFLAPTP